MMSLCGSFVWFYVCFFFVLFLEVFVFRGFVCLFLDVLCVLRGFVCWFCVSVPVFIVFRGIFVCGGFVFVVLVCPSQRDLGLFLRSFESPCGGLSP